MWSGTGVPGAHLRVAARDGRGRMAKKHTRKKQSRPSWDGRTDKATPSTCESIENASLARLTISLRGYAAILRDVAFFLEGEEKKDVIYVADRLDRTVPALEKKINEVRIPDRHFGRKTQKPLRGNK